MNNPKLKLAMARLLPKQIAIFEGDSNFYWQKNEGDEPLWVTRLPQRVIIETEWLYVMHLVEQTLDKVGDLDEPPEMRETELTQYIWALGSECKTQEEHFCATFNQRATAMCKVKEITIV